MVKTVMFIHSTDVGRMWARIVCDVVPPSADERSIVESCCSWLSGSKVIQEGSCKELLPSAASYLPITKKTFYNFSLLLTLDGPLCRNWTAVI